MLTDLTRRPIVMLNEPTEFPIGAIRVNGNTRDAVGDIQGLVATIQKYGVIEPVIITPDGELLAGKRRLTAAQAAGLIDVPVRVRDVRDPRSALEIGLIENVQRRDLDPLSRAHAYHALIREHGATVNEVAGLVEQGTAHVYQYLQLLELHPEVQRALRDGAISFADARDLTPLAPEDQLAVLAEIRSMGKQLTSRQVKQIVRKQRAVAAAKRHFARSPTDAEMSENIENLYGALFVENLGDDRRASVMTPPHLEARTELNAVVVEMLEAAQGEDRLRAWARRLSRIAEHLQADSPDGQSR
ncbi:MAG: ParB/RepB/Spo0J family partition protein [Chloroflexi bacterium]|nr:ParB/RepB/Spo0J family partition protein [Chloroflexota bacterium]